MRALVVVESVFGNTRRIAEAVADGLAERMEVRTVDVGEAPDTVGPDVDLLVVGGPTHAFGMTRESTRRSAVEQHGAAAAAATGLREWLEGVTVRPGAAAAFDTRADRPRLPGSAAAGAARRLRSLGREVVVRPESFRVAGTQGPLLDGEVARARSWAVALSARAAQRLVTGS